jgi:hypothetical protein
VWWVLWLPPQNPFYPRGPHSHFISLLNSGIDFILANETYREICWGLLEKERKTKTKSLLSLNVVSHCNSCDHGCHLASTQKIRLTLPEGWKERTSVFDGIIEFLKQLALQYPYPRSVR